MLDVNNWKFLAGIFVVSFGLGGRDGMSVGAFSQIGLTMMAQPQVDGPCIASLIGPPTKSCIQWQPNVDAAPTFEASRRLIFVGAGDDFLHVLDADNGHAISAIKTSGRVITDTLFSDDRSLLYVGTDKGVVYGFDAYSFARVFSLIADSKVNNNLTIVGDALVFTSTIGSVYSVNSKSGAINWRIEQPLVTDRLRIAENSNIIWYEHVAKGEGQILLVVPHADGYLSVINAQTGEVKKQIHLGVARPNSFPDIVAPLVRLKNRLWVASYSLGVFCIDIDSGQIRDHMSLSNIVQLASDGTSLFAASPQTLFSISETSKVIWQNNITDLRSRTPRMGFPFNRVQQGAKHMFFGTPSRLLLNERYIIMATSSGSVGIFEKATGHLLKIVGNSIGFGTNIAWAETNSFLAVSRRGLLMKFKIFNPGVIVP